MQTLKLLLVGMLALAFTGACDTSQKASPDEDEAKGESKKDKKKSASDEDEDEDEDDGEGDGDEKNGDGDGDGNGDGKNDKRKKKATEGGEDLGVEKKIGAATGAVARPEQQSYPLDAITTVADNCASPTVIMASAPESVGADYEWTWTRQAMLANGQYKVVRGEPTAPGQVSFDVHQAGPGFSNAFVLLAKCHDGRTCNHLAAMYKAVVKSSRPQVACGKLPMELSAATRKRSNVSMGEGGEADLPKTSDVIGLCARLSACMIAEDPTLSDDPGSACQKGPSNFKTACARNFPCAEVMACLKR
jgi:hypothetical protein